MTKPHTTLSEAVRAMALPTPTILDTAALTSWEAEVFARGALAMRKAAAALVEQHEAQEPVTQAGDAWISVQDRLPEFDFTANQVSMVVRVIAALRDGTVCQMGYWANGWTQEDSKPGWHFADGHRCLGHRITHWQPLPSVPTTDKKG